MLRSAAYKRTQHFRELQRSSWYRKCITPTPLEFVIGLGAQDRISGHSKLAFVRYKFTKLHGSRMKLTRAFWFRFDKVGFMQEFVFYQRTPTGSPVIIVS